MICTLKNSTFMTRHENFFSAFLPPLLFCALCTCIMHQQNLPLELSGFFPQIFLIHSWLNSRMWNSRIWSAKYISSYTFFIYM